MKFKRSVIVGAATIVTTTMPTDIGRTGTPITSRITRRTTGRIIRTITGRTTRLTIRPTITVGMVAGTMDGTIAAAVFRSASVSE